MAGAIEAAGDMATGTAWARAVEPTAGEGGAHGLAGVCLNCGTRLIGGYCHRCGQSANVHRTLASIVHDLAHGVFHFEGKIWRTLPMLVVRPGALTRRYIAGERARFVSPLALFLFTVFLMFAVYSWVGPGDLSSGFAKGWDSVDATSEQAGRDAEQSIAVLDQKRAVLAGAGRPTAALDRRIATARSNLEALVRVRKLATPDGALVSVHSRWHWLDQGIRRARENPGLVLYKLQSHAYKYSWALIILSTPFVALLFLWPRRFGMYDHATFVTYSISFMSLLAIVLEVLVASNAPNGVFVTLLWLVPPAHMFAQLRGAYGLSIGSALWRTLFLLIFASLALTLFVVGLIALEVTH